MNGNFSALRRAFQVITLLVAGGYILAWSGYFFSPDQWPAGGVFHMGFVYGWLLLLLCCIAWFFLNKTISFILLLFLIAGMAPLRHSFSVKTGGAFQVNKPAGALRIMQWNCEDLGGNLSWYTDKNIGRKRAGAFIRQYQPDVICLQDYSDYRGRIFRSNEAFIRDSLGYPFRVFARQTSQLKRYGVQQSGLNIVSKYPIVAHGVHYYKHLTSPEAIAWADIVYNQKKLRVVTTHFRSFYMAGAYQFAKSLPAFNRADSAIILGNNVVEKLTYFQRQHTQQAIQLRAFLDTCSVPVVFAADLNSVPAGFLYRLVRGNMEDGFIGNATGLGATYNYLLPNIRIDYLLHDQAIQLLQWKHFEDGFFDHDHLLGDYVPPAAN